MRKPSACVVTCVGLIALAAVLTSAGCTAPESVASSTPTSPRVTTATTLVATTSLAPTTTAPIPTTSTSAPMAAGRQATLNFGVQLSPCAYGIVNGWRALPDPRCTPGTTDPRVTQATIDSTICVKGYTSTVRPPSATTAREKVVAMAAYNAGGAPGDYEYDHLVSLELGGSPNVAANMFPEPYAGPYGARVKDRLENKLHDLVCANRVSLTVAQQAEAGNWMSAYRVYVGPLP